MHLRSLFFVFFSFFLANSLLILIFPEMAYFMTDVTKENRQDECRFSPNKEATEEDLLRIGVECTKVIFEAFLKQWFSFQVNFDDEHVQEDLDRLIKKYDMNFHDEVHICRATMPNFDEKVNNLKVNNRNKHLHFQLDIFFEEHLHDDAELRVIKHGVGFFDVRTKDVSFIEKKSFWKSVNAVRWQMLKNLWSPIFMMISEKLRKLLETFQMFKSLKKNFLFQRKTKKKKEKQEAWIRIPVRRGDFVFLPAGIYHRFTTDPSVSFCILILLEL